MPDPRPRSELLDRVLSASAALVALSALAVSVYQTKITREQQKMSAWPYVLQGNTGAAGYSRIVQNVGLGPALIRSFVVEVDGRPMHHWGEVREAVEAGAMRVCYCSLYEDCWTADTRADEPTPVRACPADPGREFER